MKTIARVRRWRRGVFYGWWLVAAAVGIQILESSLLFQAFGVYVPVWREEFGWSKTTLATAFSLQRLENGLLGPVQGWLLKRFGPRWVMRLGLLGFGFGLILLSRVHSLPGFYLTFLLLAGGASLSGFLSLMTVLVNWFERKRATALALMQVGSSIGGLLIPVIAWSLVAFGWRPTTFASGLLVLVLGLPLSQLMRSRPEDYGMLPDGVPSLRRRFASLGSAEEESPDSEDAEAETDAAPAEFTTGEALRTPAFWLLSLGHALAVMLISAVTVHLVVHLNEALGMSLQLASFVVAVLTACAMAGQFLGGFLGDRFEKRTLVTLAMIGQAAAIFVLAIAGSLPLVLVFTVIHGLAWGVRGPLMGALRADYFGRGSFATIMGFSTMIIMLGSMSGPILAGFIADRFGSYRPAFLMLAVLSLLGSGVFALARKPLPARR